MTPADEAEALDLIGGALLVMRGELEGLLRGSLYRVPWLERAEALLAKHGRLAAAPAPSNVVPFVPGPVHRGFDPGHEEPCDYLPDGPRGSL